MNKTIYFILVIPIGVFLIIYGGQDDSPGAQFLGLVVAIIGTVGAIRGRKKASGSGT